MNRVNIIREKRKKIGYTQAMLAESVGVTVTTVSNWEQGRCAPSGIAALKLSKILGIDIEEVLVK